MQKITQPEPLDFILANICHLHRIRWTQLLEVLNLYQGQPPLLRELWEEEGLTQTELSIRLKLTPATVTKMLQRLERDGWVCRSPSGDDRRVTIVRLTEAGRGLRCDVTRLWGELERETVRSLSDDERRDLLGLLAKMEQSLHAAGATGDSAVGREPAEASAEAQSHEACD